MLRKKNTKIVENILFLVARKGIYYCDTCKFDSDEMCQKIREVCCSVPDNYRPLRIIKKGGD